MGGGANAVSTSGAATGGAATTGALRVALRARLPPRAPVRAVPLAVRTHAGQSKPTTTLQSTGTIRIRARSTSLLMGDKVHVMRNNIGFPNDNAYIEGYGVDSQFNSWDLGLTPSEADFRSVSDADFMAPRHPDGSLPSLDFMKLSRSTGART